MASLQTKARLPDANARALSAEHERTIVGDSGVWKYVMYRIEQVAPTNATVLLLGETGTGKEVAARAIHDRSQRCHKSFVVVDCGALPPTLIESELFGRERGAFTGAHVSQPGRFEIANGGTVFLDEIGELPLELQPKLLRVLQEGHVERLGSGRPMHVDIRVIAATNRNLAEEIHHGRFRRDLFYRLSVFPLTLPALRERKEDLRALVHHLCDRLARELGKAIERLAPGTMEALERYEWPGNIRELENVLQRAIIVSTDGVLDLSDFVGEPLDAQLSHVRRHLQTLVEVERDYIRLALEQTGWKIEGRSGAAQALGLRPSTLRTRLRKLGIQRPSKPPAPAA